MQTIVDYHTATKHRLSGYAPGPGELLWRSQPAPFRHFSNTESVVLPLQADRLDTTAAALHGTVTVAAQPLSVASLSLLLELSLGLAAWKQWSGHGPDHRWSLRCHPSSGNLHPLEGYLLLPHAQPQLTAGVYHYFSRDHCLMRRCLWQQDARLTSIPETVCLIGLSALPWRTAWKYGERSWRYVNLDAGHAMAAIRYAATLLGWSVRLLDPLDDATIERLLGLHQPKDETWQERERPVALLAIDSQGCDSRYTHSDWSEWLGQLVPGSWQGQASPISRQQAIKWPLLAEAERLCRQPALQPAPSPVPTPGAAVATASSQTAPFSSAATLRGADIIRQRRSAQQYDGCSELPQSSLWFMLQQALPAGHQPPWDLLPWPPRLHPLLMLHRVEGMDPGLYLLVRDPSARQALQQALSPRFSWHQPSGCPDSIPLYHLASGDVQQAARQLSCQQDIASDGVFTLGMLADSAVETLAAQPWVYRQLHWEAGVLGQLFYLTAEMVGLRGTGIGCFFDDLFHDWIGLSDPNWQTLYHFTVGRALTDERLLTLAPYAHRSDRAVTTTI
ncbi:MAG: nitroreductase [Magnetococcales bacterium]|nr:nitroreductase [Magnetococcales bacterium]